MNAPQSARRRSTPQPGVQLGHPAAGPTLPVVDLWRCPCNQSFLELGDAINHQRLHGHPLATVEAATNARLLAAGDLRDQPDDNRHGTPHGYGLGCRCDLCRAARRRAREKP